MDLVLDPRSLCVKASRGTYVSIADEIKAPSRRNGALSRVSARKERRKSGKDRVNHSVWVEPKKGSSMRVRDMVDGGAGSCIKNS